MKQVATTQFIAGIDSDVNPKFIKDGTYRFAMNSVLETDAGEFPAISNEVGNSIVATLTPGYNLIGTCLTNTSDIVVFSTNNVKSEIGKFNPNNGIYTTLISSTCLNFSTKYPISCLYTIKRGCEEVIYFTDRNNKYRSINLDQLLDYTDEPTVANANSNDTWNCEEFNLTPNYSIPNIELTQVNDVGGQLKVGTYQFAIQYIDNSGNESEWFYVTNPIPIEVGYLNGDYTNITGGLPILNTAEPEDGSVPTTSKSISLQITELDTRYPYYRLAALHSTSAIGKVTETWLLEQQPIVNTVQSYTYVGPNDNIDTYGSLEDIVIDNAPIHVVGAHAQLDQSLWLANLRNVQYDYAKFQRVASKIATTPAIKPVQVTNVQNPGDPKSPFTWWNTRGFMPDEVYAFGIQYLFKDGSWSPVFHIPNRAPQGDDLSLLPASDQTEHLGIGSFPKWRVTNTGDETKFAYHEALTATYPDIKDCAGNSVWGVDSEGNHLVNQKLRFHRFPDRRSIKTYDQSTDSINIMGITFSGVEYPHEDIVKHRFVMAERTESNKTVLDNGLLVPTFTSTEDNIVTGPSFEFTTGWGSPLPLPGSVTEYNKVFFSPKTLLEQRYFNGNYFRAHTLITADLESGESEVDSTGYDTQLYVFANKCGEGLYETPQNENIVYDASVYLAPRTSQTAIGAFNNTLVNKSFSNHAYFIHHPNEVIIESKYILAASIKSVVDPYATLSNLVYYPIHTNPIAGEGDFTAYGGDSFVTALNVFDIGRVTVEGQDTSTLFITDGDFTSASAQYISGVWIDSELNYLLRHSGSGTCGSIYNGGSLLNYLREKLFTPSDGTGGGSWEQRDEICEEYYAYNIDYSKTQKEKASTSLSYQFNYCSECLNTFPYRLRVSERSYQEDSKDNYRIFKDGNRTDIPGVSGDIVSLEVYNDNLYAIAERDTYFIPINQQTIQTSESLAYLGTGERLAIPPRRISSADYPYAGSKHAFATMVTEFGLVYVDYLSKKVFLMQSENGLQDLTIKGMRRFFQNNMEFELDNQFQQVYGINFPFLDNPTYVHGLGFTLAYDPDHKRIILSKKDYRLREDKLPLLNSTSSRTRIDWSDDMFILNNYQNQTSQVLQFDNEEFFENRSWTASYSLIHGAWASFHSYLPLLMFNDANTFYSVIDNSNIYEHNVGNYQTYYGDKFDHIIDIAATSNPAVASVYDVWDINTNASIDETDIDNYFFDRILVYNSYQSSGIQTLSLKTNTYSNTTSNNVYAVRTERNWKVNNFRDFVVNYNVPLFSRDWTDISTDYFIDKVPNPQAIDLNKSAFEQGRFRDHYVGCRLYFNPDNNVKLVTNLISSINKISYR